jgi:hypothetical protein
MDAALAGLIGVLLGSAATSFFQSHFNFKKELLDRESSFREVRYKAIAIMMYSKLHPETLDFLTMRRPEIKNQEDLEQELNMELMNSFLFANDEVIKNFNLFIKNSSEESFIKTMLAMRKDLWGRKTKVNAEIFK